MTDEPEQYVRIDWRSGDSVTVFPGQQGDSYFTPMTADHFIDRVIQGFVEFTRSIDGDLVRVSTAAVYRIVDGPIQGYGGVGEGLIDFPRPAMREKYGMPRVG